MNKPFFLLRIFFVILSTLILSIPSQAQTNYLNKKISVSVSEVALKDALTEISLAGGFDFSYNSLIIDQNRIVSLEADRISVTKALDALLLGEIEYKATGRHVILLRKKEQVVEKEIITHITLSGNITNSASHAGLPDVTIYNINDRSSAISGSGGAYSMILPANKHFLALSFSKRGFRDTIVFFEAQVDNRISVSLSPEIDLQTMQPIEASVENSKLSELQLVNTFVSREALINAENLLVFEQRPAQISFLPYLGSNAKVSGTRTNNVSVNVIAGFTGAVNGVEVGSVLNITKRHVNGVQVVGFGNITGEYSRGAQVAGVFNKTTGSVVGAQLSGFTNIVLDTVTGVQIAGFNNVLRGKMKGVQLSGFSNLTTQNVDGVQLSGFANTALKDVKAAQVSGFINYSKGENKGAQVAGFINYAKGSNKGMQLAGFINIADTLNGVQLSVINICDTSSGVSVGLFSHVKKGFRSVEVSTNEVFYLNAGYRSGTHKFYNVFTIGANPSGLYPWGVGFGFGSVLFYPRKLSIGLELTSSFVNESQVWEQEVNTLNKFSVTANYKLGDHLTLVAGPSYNVHVSGVKDEQTDQFTSDIAVNPFFESVTGANRVQMWIGGTVGLRFW